MKHSTDIPQHTLESSTQINATVVTPLTLLLSLKLVESVPVFVPPMSLRPVVALVTCPSTRPAMLTSPYLLLHLLAVHPPPAPLVQGLPLEAPLPRPLLALTAQLQTVPLTRQMVKSSRLSVASIVKVEAQSMPSKRTAWVLALTFVQITLVVLTCLGSQATVTSRMLLTASLTTLPLAVLVSSVVLFLQRPSMPLLPMVVRVKHTTISVSSMSPQPRRMVPLLLL